MIQAYYRNVESFVILSQKLHTISRVRSIYRMSVFFWILMGLTWIGGVISMISDNFQQSFDAVKEVRNEEKKISYESLGNRRLQCTEMQCNIDFTGST